MGAGWEVGVDLWQFGTGAISTFYQNRRHAAICHAMYSMCSSEAVFRILHYLSKVMRLSLKQRSFIQQT